VQDGADGPPGESARYAIAGAYAGLGVLATTSATQSADEDSCHWFGLAKQTWSGIREPGHVVPEDYRSKVLERLKLPANCPRWSRALGTVASRAVRDTPRQLHLIVSHFGCALRFAQWSELTHLRRAEMTKPYEAMDQQNRGIGIKTQFGVTHSVVEAPAEPSA